MKKTLLILSMLALSLAACSKKAEPDTPEEKLAKQAYERYEASVKELKNKVPHSEIVGQVEGSDVFIHRFYDEKNGTNCYFINYDYKNLSCVK